jgi:hypothetical protein
MVRLESPENVTSATAQNADSRARAFFSRRH